MKSAFLFGVLLVFGLSPLPLASQDPSTGTQLTEKQWDDLYAALDLEDWSRAADYSAKYLRQLKDEGDKRSLGRLRYMFVFASAGKVIERKMAFEELGKVLTDLLAREIVLPGRRLTTNCPAPMNSICVLSGSKYDLSSAAANNHGTSIHAFEYVKLQDKFDAKGHDGDLAEVSGILDSFQLNPNKSTIWIMRLFIDKGHVALER